MWNMSSNLSFAAGGFPQGIRFVLVNNRVPRTDEHCAVCGGPKRKVTFVIHKRG